MKQERIRARKRLAKLEAIKFISNEFDEHAKDRKEKKKRIKTLEDCLINRSKQIDNLFGQFKKQEQHSRDNCLLLHGFPKNRNEKLMVCVLLHEMNNLNYRS